MDVQAMGVQLKSPLQIMIELRLYLLQRVTAAVMAPLVLLHLGLMIYAVQGGLDANEILARTRGSLFWGSTYLVFVLAVAMHAAIGLRNILREWGQLNGRLLNTLSLIFGLGLLSMGLRAIFAVVIG